MQAAVRIAVEMFKEGAMTKDVAITKVHNAQAHIRIPECNM